MLSIINDLERRVTSKISIYNLAHNEIGECCGIFDRMDEKGIIYCNECDKTLREVVLSLPSSSSKTEAVTLELKLWKTVQNDLAEIMEAKMELENYDSWVYNKIDLLEQELDKLENE